MNEITGANMDQVIVDELVEPSTPSAFKQEWEAKKLLKRAKKKSKKQLMKQGHSAGNATRLVNYALKNIVNKPERKAAGRGG